MGERLAAVALRGQGACCAAPRPLPPGAGRLSFLSAPARSHRTASPQPPVSLSFPPPATQDFYEDIFLELAQYGEVEYLNVCDNLADHMVGNVYVKFR